VQSCVQGCGILEQVVGFGPLHCLTGAGEQPLDIYAHECRRQETDRRKYAEAPAHFGRHIESGNTVVIRELA
jgi:hypothetical protein